MSAIIIHETVQQHQLINKSVDAFLTNINARLSPRTAKAYQTHINHFKRWFLDTRMDSDLRTHLQAYRSHLIERYGSAKSVNLALSTLRSLYKFLYENAMIEYDPTVVLKNVKEAEGVKKSPLTREQLSLVIHQLNHSTKRRADRDRALFLTFVLTGARRNELVNAKVEDIGMYDGRHCLYLLRKGYHDKSNMIVLNDTVYPVLIEYIGDKKSGYIFTSERTGDKMNPDTISRLIKSILRESGFDSKQLSLHSLRTTFATFAIDAGASLFSLQRALNHRSPTTTMNYIKSADRTRDAAEDRVTIDIDV